MSDLLRAEAVSKTWSAGGPAPVHAVRDAALAVTGGEMVVITGPSGSGKTTLLAMLAGLLRPDRGRVVLDGLDLTAASEKARRQARLTRLGFVFQRGLLLQHLSARDNVALVLRAAGTPRRLARGRADELLDRLGLRDRAGFYPAALSPGECQRVAVARALVPGPRLVLADEPTAHLDSTTGLRVVEELRRLASAGGAGVVVVTHDARLATAASRVMRLEDGRLLA